MTPRPKINAFLICDTIIQDRVTNKRSLIGVFHNIATPAFPCTHPMTSIYVNFIDAMGEYRIEINLVEVTTGKTVGRASLPPFEVKDRLRSTEISIALQNLTFHNPGKYEFQLSANEELLASKDFLVDRVERPEVKD